MNVDLVYCILAFLIYSALICYLFKSYGNYIAGVMRGAILALNGYMLIEVFIRSMLKSPIGTYIPDDVWYSLFNYMQSASIIIIQVVLYRMAKIQIIMGEKNTEVAQVKR